MSDDKPKLLGDLTAEKLKQLRLDRVADRFSRFTGKPCKCAERQEKLNNVHRRFTKNG